MTWGCAPPLSILGFRFRFAPCLAYPGATHGEESNASPPMHVGVGESDAGGRLGAGGAEPEERLLHPPGLRRGRGR